MKSKRPIHSALLYYGYDNFRLDILATIPNNPASGVVSIESKGELVKLVSRGTSTEVPLETAPIFLEKFYR